MKYTGKMDKECVELCDAINQIPFLITFESCCGHGKDKYHIWLRARNVEGLYLLARCIDPRYCGPCTSDAIPWSLFVEDSDLYMSVSFHLQSCSSGELAYRQSRNIARNIRRTLKDKACMQSWLAGWTEKK